LFFLKYFISLPKWKLLINETVIVFIREFICNKKMAGLCPVRSFSNEVTIVLRKITNEMLASLLYEYAYFELSLFLRNIVFKVLVEKKNPFQLCGS